MRKKFFAGYTLMEMAVVISLLSLLFGLVWLNLLSSKESASQNASIDVLVSDLRSQQLKAMLGDTEGRLGNDAYGIHFNAASYTLFHGTTYLASDPSNQTIALTDNEQFQSITFPASTILFASISGQVVGFSPVNNSFVLKNVSTNTQKTFQINELGTIYAIN